MKHLIGTLKLAALAAVFISFGPAASGSGPAEPSRRLTVIELFTSQSCYNCPPAELFLGELIEGRDDVLGLEFHVDYWDRLAYRSFGRWKDLFSNPEYTERQYAYGRHATAKRGYVFTPQMIIDGVEEVRGSRRNAVLEILERRRLENFAPLQVSVVPGKAGGLHVDVAGNANGQIWLIEFLREATTEVPRGENHGKKLTNHNIVTDVRWLADFDGGRQSVEISPLPTTSDRGCAIIVQVKGQGPILGAGVCPSASS